MYQLRKNYFKQNIKEFKKQIGIWSCLSNNSIVEILSLIGYDWIVIDMEHSPNEIPEVLTQLQIIQNNSLFKTEPIVRVPWNDFVVVKRVLDLGAQTILFPYIQNENDAINAIKSVYYPLNGIRGVMSAARMNKYGLINNYYDNCNKEISIIIQCETKESIYNIPKFIKMNEIDGIFIGPSDLSASIGKIGQINDKEVQDLINIALNYCKEYKKPIGILTSNKELAKKYLINGFTFVGINSDLNLFTQSAKLLLDEFKK